MVEKEKATLERQKKAERKNRWQMIDLIWKIINVLLYGMSLGILLARIIEKA